MWRMSAGREFPTDKPATENARSPNLVTVSGTVYENVSVEERSPCRRDDAAVVWTTSMMYLGQH